MVNEARKQVMWAIDFRDMHTAIHGLYYAKDRKLVEEFYEALKSVFDDGNPEYADDPELREIDYQTILDEFYSRGIQQIDEINFRDIGKLPSGKYGIIVDDVEYRLVNNVSMDIYEESTRKTKMKFKKIVRESLDYCRCDVCGKREREDRFNLPPLAENNGDAAEHRAWLEFVREHIKDFSDLGFRRMRYSMGFSFNPICERCCEKMYSNPKYKALWKEWCAYRDEAAKRADVPTNESTGKQNMKFKKIVNEAEEGEYASDHPRIYVGTYAKYNDGSIDGKWIDISEYNTYEEFVDACRELHADEEDPEFMV